MLPVSTSIVKSQIPSNLELADPEFHKPRPVDMIIGAEIFYELLCIGQIKLVEQPVSMQKSVFGRILLGVVQKIEETQAICLVNICENLESEEGKTYNVSKQLRQFWELEEIDGRPEAQYTQEVAECEDQFKQTCTKDHSGRHCVQYPLRPEVFTLGESRKIAER